MNSISCATREEVDKVLAEYAAKFQVLADPLRLKIIILLREGERCVCELVDLLGQKQPRISYHLKLMTDVGLIQKRTEGTWSYYSLNQNVKEWVKGCCQFLTARDIASIPKPPETEGSRGEQN